MSIQLKVPDIGDFEQVEIIEVIVKAGESIKKNDPAVLFTFLCKENETEIKKQSPILVIPDDNPDASFKKVGDIKAKKKELFSLAEKVYLERENKIINFREQEVFVQIFPRQDQLLIIGAGHISIPLVNFAKELNFFTVITSPDIYLPLIGFFIILISAFILTIILLLLLNVFIN